MKPLETLEINVLIDMLADYSLKYSTLKKDMASYKKTDKYKAIIESIMNEIDRRKRATIRPYNDILQDRKDERSKSA